MKALLDTNIPVDFLGGVRQARDELALHDEKAISIISAEGQPFHSPEADAALFDAIKEHLDPKVTLIEMECEINDPVFALACANALLKSLNARKR